MLDQNLSEALRLSPSFSGALLSILQSVSICGVFFAAMKFGARLFSRIQIVFLLISILLSVFLISRGSNGVGGFQISRGYVSSLTRPALIELPLGIEKTMPIENRRASVLLAKNAYENYGKIIEYVTESGERIRFYPTEEDIKARDRMIEMSASIDVLNARASAFRMEAWIYLLVAALLGYCAGIAGRPRQP